MHSTDPKIAPQLIELLALERRLEREFTAQIDETDEAPIVVAELRHIQENCIRHVGTLETLMRERELLSSGIAETIARAVTPLIDAGSAMIGAMRGTTLADTIRNGYTSISHACIGYVALHSMALSLNDSEVGDMACEHLQRHAISTSALRDIMPMVVIRCLRDEGHFARAFVLPEISRNLQRAWQIET